MPCVHPSKHGLLVHATANLVYNKQLLNIIKGVAVHGTADSSCYGWQLTSNSWPVVSREGE